MGLKSAVKKIKKAVKKATGFSSASDALKSFTSPEMFVTTGWWDPVMRAPKVIQGWSDILGFSDMFTNDFDMPESATPAEILYPQQTDSEGGSNVNRRRRANPYATSGGALGDSTYATSGVRNKLG